MDIFIFILTILYKITSPWNFLYIYLVHNFFFFILNVLTKIY